ncbi:MAG: hypothetical protein KGZ94_08405 [Clostridia bacterium]|jgi:hypothetical protein|nr:hypothetical protein [Desulfitibacter alkalitolerans]MBS3970120.1 hypothetical protein [Clostridia bacterium]
MGITEEELAETIQVVSSVSAGIITAMSMRAQKRSEPEQKGNLADIYKK